MLDQFHRYLIQNAQIQEKYIPYYLKWISECYTYLNEPIEHKIHSEQKQQFLNHLSKNHEEWQVKQADYALRPYNFFLSHQREKPSPASADSVKKWSVIEEESRKALRLRHRSLNTEKSYIIWLHQFQGFISSKDPEELEGTDLQNFLTHLAVERRVSASTQSQALNALIFVYRHVLNKKIESFIEAVRAKRRRLLPVVLTPQEVEILFDKMSGMYRLMAMLIYGCGLRLTECASLRIKDIDLERGIVIVRAAKGDKDRRTVLPERLKDPLIQHLATVRSMYENDRKQNLPGVFLPDALEKKYPNAGKEWGWFWLFPSQSLSIDPRSLIVRRHHLHPASLQRAFREALQQTGISKQVSVHTLRHYAELRIMPSSFARTQIHQAIDPLRTRHSFDRFGSTEMAGLRNGGSCPVRVKPRLNLRKMPNGKALGLFILF